MPLLLFAVVYFLFTSPFLIFFSALVVPRRRAFRLRWSPLLSFSIVFVSLPFAHPLRGPRRALHLLPLSRRLPRICSICNIFRRCSIIFSNHCTWAPPTWNSAPRPKRTPTIPATSVKFPAEAFVILMGTSPILRRVEGTRRDRLAAEEVESKLCGSEITSSAVAAWCRLRAT